MSYTVLNSAMSSTLLSDPEVVGLFSADADLVAMPDFEAALAEAEAEAGFFLKPACTTDCRSLQRISTRYGAS